MGCRGCPPKPKRDPSVDRHGNIRGTEPPPSTEEQVIAANEQAKRLIAEHRKASEEMSYTEYIKGRAAFREESRKMGTAAIEHFSDDYKRIQIHELISIYNLDEFGHMSPEQALVALWELLHSKGYDKIFGEFENLSEEVDRRYEELVKKRLPLNWKV